MTHYLNNLNLNGLMSIMQLIQVILVLQLFITSLVILHNAVSVTKYTPSCPEGVPHIEAGCDALASILQDLQFITRSSISVYTLLDDFSKVSSGSGLAGYCSCYLAL